MDISMHLRTYTYIINQASLFALDEYNKSGLKALKNHDIKIWDGAQRVGDSDGQTVNNSQCTASIIYPDVKLS